MQEIVVDGTVANWTELARSAVLAGLGPQDVVWTDVGAQPARPEVALHPGALNLFEAAALPVVERSKRLAVPGRFVELVKEAGCHRDPTRWALLYRVLWRLTHGESHLLEVAVDPDVIAARALEKAVHHDVHKMRAFVRFQSVADESGERFVAWYRPDHFIVEMNAPWFRDRFASQRWSILTPDRCAHWDGAQLTFSAGLDIQDPPQDAAEDLWRTYYRSTFNPARLKLDTMARHMPKRFWDLMPELQDVPAMAAAAAARSGTMIEVSAAKKLPTEFVPAQPHGGLKEMAEAVQRCRACALWKNATCAVFGEGPAHAKIVVVGEQPGDQEDKGGRPFIGPAGKLLDRALAEAGLDRSELYLTNAVKHFKWEPRGKFRLHAKPGAREIAACRPWLEAELKRIKPKLIICLGGTAARAVCGEEVKVTQERGRMRDTEFGAPALITLHPSALLRLPEGADAAAEFAHFVRDLRQAKD